MIPKDQEELKEKALSFLRGLFEAIYPKTEGMKKDYIALSKSVRKVLRASEIILESEEFDKLEIDTKFYEVVSRMEESEEGSEDFERASDDMIDLFKTSFQTLEESEDERLMKASSNLMKDVPQVLDGISFLTERFRRRVIEPFGLSEIEPTFPETKKPSKKKSKKKTSTDKSAKG